MFFTSAAHAAPSKIWSPGVYLGAGSDPFPSLGSVGVTLTLLDILRLEAGTEGVIAAIASISGRQVYNVGFGAKLKLPKQGITPVIGLGTSRQFFKENSVTWGKRRVEEYIYASGGLEWHFTHIYFGAGIIYVFHKNESNAWVSLSGDKIHESPVWPNVYVGLHF